MTIKNNQIETPFTTTDKSKLDAIEANAKTYEIASQAEAEAGVDNAKLLTSLRVSQAIQAQADGNTLITKTYTNDSGSTIIAFTPVRQDSSGNIAPIDPATESDVQSFLGLLLQNTVQAASGSVALGGLLQNVTTSYVLNDTLYLSKTGGLTNTVPEIGVASFVEGDFVFKIGKIAKNSSNPSNKDIKFEFELLGQL